MPKVNPAPDLGRQIVEALAAELRLGIRSRCGPRCHTHVYVKRLNGHYSLIVKHRYTHLFLVVYHEPYLTIREGYVEPWINGMRMSGWRAGCVYEVCHPTMVDDLIAKCLEMITAHQLHNRTSG